MIYILDIPFDVINLRELYKLTKNKFESIDEFLYSLDTLYILGKVEFNADTGELKKC